MEKKRGPSKEGHRMFREDPEALSERSVFLETTSTITGSMTGHFSK
jgi:hypothetical protein